jgi:hypothetical protein
MERKGVLAEELIKVSRKFRKLFLEQSVEDLGEVPAEPIGDEEAVNVDIEELGKEAYGEEVQEIVSAFEDAGVEGVEVESPTTFVVERDGKRITFEVATIEGEPVVVIYTEDGRITVSLAPVIGYVTAPEDAVDKLANDENAVKEFVGLVGDVVGIEGEEADWVEDEEVEEEEVEDEKEFETEEDIDVEDEEEEDMDLEDEDFEEEEDVEEEGEEVSESRLRRRRRGLRFREQTTEYDMASGRRDITIGLIQDSDEKIGSIPVKTIDITKDVPKAEGDGREGMTFPNLYALFSPKEGLPDVQGFVSQEVKQGEEVKGE